MRVDRVVLQNVKGFKSVQLQFPKPKAGEAAGWYVIVGDNGQGKTTVLQSIALGLLGPDHAASLVRRPDRWVRQGSPYGSIQVDFSKEEADNAPAGASTYEAILGIAGSEALEARRNGVEIVHHAPGAKPVTGTTYSAGIRLLSDEAHLAAGPYGPSEGWFSAGYGPYRRMEGSGTEFPRGAAGRADRFRTLYTESASLTDGVAWFAGLVEQVQMGRTRGFDRTMLEYQLASEALVASLPEGISWIRSEANLTFRGRGGASLAPDELSDGFRSYTSMVLDIVRSFLNSKLGERFDGRPVLEPLDLGPSDIQGVVLIDEVDAHLHPKWQRTIAELLCKAFPRVQFIVTTHSPFVVQDTSPGGLFVIRDSMGGGFEIEAPPWNPRSWSAEQLLLSEAFGLVTTKDDGTEVLVARLQQLADDLGEGRLASSEYQEALSEWKLRLASDPIAEASLQSARRSREIADRLDPEFTRVWSDVQD